MQLKYVRFWNEMALNEYDGYVVKEDDTNIYIIYPMTHDWIHYLNKWEWLEKMNLHQFEKNLFQPRTTVRYIPDLEPIKWMFDFPIESFGIDKLPKVANFYEQFLYNAKLPFHKRLEETIDRTYFLFEKHEMKQILEFILEQLKDKAKEERLKIVLSGKIQEFLA